MATWHYSPGDREADERYFATVNAGTTKRVKVTLQLVYNDAQIDHPSDWDWFSLLNPALDDVTGLPIGEVTVESVECADGGEE